MVRLFARLLLGVLVVLQSVGPALANDWMLVENSCGCAVVYACCESVTLEFEACSDCVTEVVSSEACGCSGTQHTEPTMEKACESVPAETKKPESMETEKPTEALPPTETPVPTLQESDTELPAAQIPVPSDPAPATSSTNELFPGPAVTPPAEEPATKPQRDTEGLFDEPAAPVAEPRADAEVTETEEKETQTTEDLFVEPSQPTADETEETEAPTTETETPEAETKEPAAETEEPAAESNPLDELFGPSTPVEDPAPQKEESQEEESVESESIDPFGRQELPTLDVAPSLANSASRSWSDFRANFRCEARLVRVTTAGVFLAKESGERVEIAFAELSDADLNFVREQVRAQRALLAPALLAARAQ